mmetsp:Transcript_22089/g.71126  ORF Transcript_22089/g.71126 Transcript_22089/m.71126 type:complete len:166 (-) Transcript_22089:3-500(-)
MGYEHCLAENCNASYDEVLEHLTPYGWGYIGIAMGLGLSVVGAAWGMWLTGSSLVGAAIKAPRIRSKNLISIIFCEATAIYGVILAILLLSKIGDVSKLPVLLDRDSWDYNQWYFAGYALFSAGMSVGLTNVASGISVGIAGSGCAPPHAPDSTPFLQNPLLAKF